MLCPTVSPYIVTLTQSIGKEPYPPISVSMVDNLWISAISVGSNYAKEVL